MIVTVSSWHMEVSDPLKQYAEQKANKLNKYYDRIQEIEVIFDNGIQILCHHWGVTAIYAAKHPDCRVNCGPLNFIVPF